MANQYQNRPYPTDDAYGRDAQPRGKGEGDPLAELARLIGQTDPFASNTRATNTREAPRRAEQAYREDPSYQDEPSYDDAQTAPPSPPPWMQRIAGAREPQQQEFDNLHPAQRYALQHGAPETDEYQASANAGHAAHADDYQHQDPVDPSRYDDALYGHADHGQAAHPQDDQYQDDPYAYQDGYAEQEEAPKRRSGIMTVAAVLALAVIGTGGAFAYRTFVGSARTGEPPVIKAEPGPNKVIPPSATASADASGKPIQDRLGGSAERLVSREEQPVNVQDATKAGPRVVFPPLNQNANPPSTASVSPNNKPMVGNGAMQGDEPRKIRTFAVKGDQADGAATPAARQTPARLATPAAAPAAVTTRPSNANASANAPMSLSPQAPAPVAAAPAPAARVASINSAPQQIAPSAAGNGGYVVQISSQRSESEAQASFRALQGKFPSVLGSRTPLIKRADLGDKGTYYRAMVGPFGSPDEAGQFCGNLKSAGGQCVVQRN